jgi:hypothetical protein
MAETGGVRFCLLVSRSSSGVQRPPGGIPQALNSPVDGGGRPSWQREARDDPTAVNRGSTES